MEIQVPSFEDALRRAAGWTMVVAAGSIVIGAFVIAMPLTGALAAVLIFGATTIVAGGLDLAYALRMRDDAGAIWRFFLALVELVVGAYVVARPDVGVLVLSLWLGVMVIIRGLVQLALATQLRTTHVWGWFVLDGVVSAGLGLLLLARWPHASYVILGVWVGASLIVNGIQRLVVASLLRRALPPSQQAPRPPLHAAPV